MSPTWLRINTRKANAVKRRACHRLYEKVSEILKVAQRTFGWNLKSSSVTFVFCSMSKDARELNGTEISLLVHRRASVQPIQLLVCNSTSYCCLQLSQGIFLNGASCFFIKGSKGISEDMFRICAI